MKLCKLIKKFNTDPCGLNKIRLDSYNKIYNSLIISAKNTYYINRLNKSWGNSKAQWDMVNSITGTLKNDTHGVSILLINNKHISNHKHIANAFAEYFSTIGKN